MKKLIFAALLLAATTGMASAGTGPFGADIFVRGIDGDWGETNVMTYDAGTDTYSAMISITGLDHNFKIATADWDTAAWGVTNFDLTGTDSVTALILDQRFGGTDASLNLGAAGLYLFSLDVSTFDTQGLNGDYNLTISRQVVPIPAAGLLLLSAIGGLGLFRRK